MSQPANIQRIARRGRISAHLLAVALLPLIAGFSPVDPPDAVVSVESEAEPADERLRLWRRGASEPRLQVVDSLIASRIESLRESSPTFAQAWDELVASEVPIIIGTRVVLNEILPPQVQSSSAWAGITATWGVTRGLDRAAVAIRTDWLEQLHRTYATPPGAFLDALDGLIIHEVYGHLVPVVRARDARRQCADPREGQRLSESCVGKRELAIKAERRAVLASREE